MTIETRGKINQALRAADEIARLLEGEEWLGHPVVTVSKCEAVMCWYLFTDSDHEKSDARKVMKAVGGKWEKRPLTDLYEFWQKRGRVTLRIVVNRATVCRRVVVASREVERIVPAQEEHTVVDVEEEVEWVCEPVLGDDS